MRLHLFHDWSKWETTEAGNYNLVHKFTGATYENGKYEHQQRICQTCGRKEMRTIKTRL